jgi:hypothetical protein
MIPDDPSFSESLAQDVLKATRAKIEANVFSLTCPVHGMKPKWKSVQSTGTTADLKFDCCCQKLASMIQKALQ